MKLERLHEYILITVVLTIGMVLAALAGKYSGSGQTSTLAMIVGGVLVALIGLQMRASIWLLIVLTMNVPGKLTCLPLPFTIQETGVLLAFGWYLIFKAVKIVRNKPVYGLLDVVMGVNLAWLLVAFLRHPVGVDALGSDRVGGRPYVTIVISVLAYWVLSRADLGAGLVRRLPFIVALTSLFDATIGALTFFVPSTAGPLSRIYSGVSMDSVADPGALADGMSGESRLGFLGWSGRVGILALSSYYRPLTCINPLYVRRFLITIFCIALILFSGFRNFLMASILSMAVASYFQRRTLDIWRMAMFGVPVLALLLTAQGVVLQLPFSVQRTLSFLPAQWDPRAKSDAEGSTEWRVYMWKAMLTEGGKYLHDRWLGDGFGYTRMQLREMQFTNAEGGAQESFLITGQVHSGPLSTIKYVGYIGLGLYMTLLIILARQAARLMRRAYGTPYLPWSLFVGVPAVIEPVTFSLIVGGYDGAMAGTILIVGVMKLLERGLDDYEKTQGLSATKETEAGTGTTRSLARLAPSFIPTKAVPL